MTTTEQPTVRPGQVWQDCDPRYDAMRLHRYLRVESRCRVTAPLPGIRPGQIWMSRQLRKGGVHQRVLVTGGGMGDVYVNVLGEHDTVVDHRNLAREGLRGTLRAGVRAWGGDRRCLTIAG